jgi:hypothetical protein
MPRTSVHAQILGKSATDEFVSGGQLQFVIPGCAFGRQLPTPTREAADAQLRIGESALARMRTIR